ncbi:hypothetical protein MLD38_004421 [Melastoma candidum]|uniref:Uncharacterized protein n=1 Tax=Melastoma candidum TaxID=119954 RepID=A0ACB9S4V0_9MYRT|nr:hypothetical protein MLD38_004421 [Melastoma candidum]
MTLGGLLALGYTVVVSYKRASTCIVVGNISLSLETIDNLGETFLVLRGTNRKAVGTEAVRIGITGPWITKSYLEMILERKGVPRLRNFIIQPKVDFDIGISTVAGLQNLGYHAVAYIEASAFIYQDGKILIEVDHLQDVTTPYLQIKGVNKEAVAAAGSALKLDGSYPTKSYLQIILERLPAGCCWKNTVRSGFDLIKWRYKGSSSSSETSHSRDVTPLEGIIEDVQKLERWHAINTLLWTFLISALIGYSLYHVDDISISEASSTTTSSFMLIE